MSEASDGAVHSFEKLMVLLLGHAQCPAPPPDRAGCAADSRHPAYAREKIIGAGLPGRLPTTKGEAVHVYIPVSAWNSVP